MDFIFLVSPMMDFISIMTMDFLSIIHFRAYSAYIVVMARMACCYSHGDKNFIKLVF